MLELYKNIRKYRKENGWTQQELADRAGYGDRSSISKIESGEVDLPQSAIIKFAKVFGVAPGDLMGYDGCVDYMDQLTDTERRLIVAYRASSDEIQEAVCSILKVRRPASSSSAGRSA